MTASPKQNKIFWFLLCLQWVTVVVLAFGDFGFDKPSRFGLDFGHRLLLMAFYCGCTLGLIIFTINRRSRWCAVLTIGSILLHVLAIVYVWTRPVGPMRPALILVILGLAILAWYWSHFDSESRLLRRLLREISQRQPLDDQTFQDRYYPANDSASRVASDLRRICAKRLGLTPEELIPDDDIGLLFCELDIGPVVEEIQVKYGCDVLDDSPKDPYTLSHLIDYVVLNGNITDATLG